ncbi:MAG: DUF2442 domain-containing protein, partial [Cyclobacteriaceae bacterium]|nr:DUF2442 domain-containing protein [Cyclobacteriaceae bacterium]
MNSLDDIQNKQSADPFDVLIFEKGIRAKNLLIDKELDLLVVVLNNGIVLKMHLYDYPVLQGATLQQLEDWELIGDGVGVRWKQLDEDLSIKGFIKSSALSQAL